MTHEILAFRFIVGIAARLRPGSALSASLRIAPSQ